MKIYFFSLLFCQILFTNAWIFSPLTFSYNNYSNKFQVSLSGFMAAFGDFNADRAVDIFVLDKNKEGSHLDVMLMAKENSAKLPKRSRLFTYKNDVIRNVFTGDFNGDSILDVVICTSNDISGPYAIDIAYGNTDRDNVTIPASVHSNLQFSSQPLHLDWNADMIGDIFGLRTPQNDFVVLIGNTNKTFSLKPLPGLNMHNMDKLLFSYFVDLNQDGQADILLVGSKGQELILTSIIKKDSDFQQYKSMNVSQIPVRMGQPIIGDFLFDGTLQMLWQACGDDKCIDSKLIGCDLGNLACTQANFTSTIKDTELAFQYNSLDMAKLSLAVPEVTTMSCGDLRMNGFIECIMTMYEVKQPKMTRLVQLNNQGGWSFSLGLLEGDQELYRNVSQAAIFDILENGIPDIITARPIGKTGIISPLLHDTTGDNYFLKVMVLNGLCDSVDTCPGKRFPFGIPLPGVIVNYTTEGTSGKAQSSMVSLMTTSAFTSLMQPYAFFGLSTFSNYIEKLTIQLPSATIARTHTLTFIVPKTQIVIIPYPLDNPNKWTYKLFIEPFADKKVIYVAAALLGTMFLVSIVLCILQYLEVREDRLEKMQEAQKFNFDAM